MNGPHWIKQWIADLALLNEQFRNDDGSVDFSALGREEYQFRMALITRRFAKSERAKDVYDKAKIAYDANVENGKKGGRPRKIQDTTADGDIREDSQDRESGTSANLYGDAGHREAPDESATVSKDMPRVGQNGTHPRNQGGGRAAQGAMSRSTEAAAQSGKAYDQETYQASTDEDRQSQRRTGADSVRGTPSHRAPARQRAQFRNKEDFIQWAIDDGLDPVDAGECWEATEERHGKDADGNTVKNMKAFARQWCRTRANNRRTA